MKLSLSVSRKNRFYVYIAANILVVAALGVFVLRPIFGLLVKHTAEITQTKKDIAKADQKAAKLRELKNDLPKYEAEYGPILANVPKQKDTAAYQTELEALAKLTSVTLKTVDSTAATPGGGTSSGGSSGSAGSASSGSSSSATKSQSAPASSVGSFPSTPFTVSVSGTYATILDFVSRLETMNRFTKVTAIDFKADGTGLLNTTINLQTFYLK